MKQFMCEDFLLSNDTAKRLYHDFAKEQPIFDFHCHLNPSDIAKNRQFENLAQIWLEGDHYKWRAMRSAGIPEQFITGDSSDIERYMAWARTVPQCIGNPLYHWTHLELRRPFGITGKLFGPSTAKGIWHQCNDMLTSSDFSARGILKQMNVSMVGTTDDPIDSLIHHDLLAKDKDFDVQVRPTWRPDKVIKIEADGFAQYLQSLGGVADIDITNFSDLLLALSRRLDHFEKHGCRAADHGLEVVRYEDFPSERALDRILQRRIEGKLLLDIEIAQFSTAVQVWLGRQYAKRGWVMQLHIGAQRNNSSRMLKLIGPDSGFDSIGDRTFAFELSALLDRMDGTDQLPKTVIYCLNPRDNEVIATMIGNFQGGGIPGKVQFGSGWWFNDQKDGMERQMEQVAQLSLLSQFIGMLTDSRSFLSYTRHEYFRRILCDLLGRRVENGEIPGEDELLGPMIENICFNNAEKFFLAKE
ncbi:glucuronate isomerase [Vibrio atypicus]|uniref:glucuronate isomerase n=1 Tax=Vibrio atypicus TaxID=558271 RepID=UPI003735CB58